MTFKTLPTALLLFGTLGFAVCGAAGARQTTQNAPAQTTTKHKTTGSSKSGSAAKSSSSTKTASAGKSKSATSTKSASSKSSSGKGNSDKSSSGTKSTSGRSASSKSSKHGKSSGSHAPGQKAPTPERITEIQQALAKNGALGSDPTGKWDDSTVEGMRKFQAAHGLNPSGKLDALTLRQLGLGSPTAGLAAPSPTVKTSSAATLPADMQPQ